MSNFKIIFITAFVVAALFGFLVFSGIIHFGSTATTTTNIQGTVTIWGTVDSRAMAAFVTDFNIHNANIHIAYQQKDTSTFDQSLVEAIAGGTPPDLVLLPNNLVWRFQNKLTHIPFASLPAQTFQSTFISAANVFTAPDGTLAVPWAADPLVVYYNRDLLQAQGIAVPPKNWTEFSSTVSALTKKTSDLTITTAGTAMGTYANIFHAKDILALLFMQSGSSFITTNASGALAVDFGPVANADRNAAAIAATNFYMAFSDPLKPVYTWNGGEPYDRDAFIQSKLAYYFGTASELPIIRSQNPNLNFGIALPPQGVGGTPLTTGAVYGLAIPKSAPNQLLSYTATTLLASVQSESALTNDLQSSAALIPVRRDVLAQKPAADPYLSFLYDAVLIERSWIDPNPAVSEQIFSSFIRSISSSALPVDQALAKMATQLGALGGSQ